MRCSASTANRKLQAEIQVRRHRRFFGSQLRNKRLDAQCPPVRLRRRSCRRYRCPATILHFSPSCPALLPLNPYAHLSSAVGGGGAASITSIKVRMSLPALVNEAFMIFFTILAL